MFNKIGLIFRTLYYLKFIQLVYQIKFRFGAKVLSIQKKLEPGRFSKILPFSFLEPSTSYKIAPYEFNFLNQKVIFNGDIEWNYIKNGKLWNYNLNYLDFINKPDIKYKESINVINSYFQDYKSIKVGKDPYPTSLRIINLIKFSSRYSSKNLELIVKKDVSVLLKSLEYHILGNHLLENAFALYFSAHVFPENQKLIKKAKKLLKNQIEEQILDDGGHYERSFMYHQIILGRLLESISLSLANKFTWNIEFVNFLKERASKMIQWSCIISNDGRNFVRFNDSVEGIAPLTHHLLGLASELEVSNVLSKDLSDSGFRVWKKDKYVMTINIGEITPTYQPGHAHADTFSFTLHKDEIPIIVDPGISTYSNNNERQNQRSSSYHNTVTVNEKDNNEVWSAFRVGRRARVKINKDSLEEIDAVHDGFRSIGSFHRRKWKKGCNEFIISDYVDGVNFLVSKAYIHFHPEMKIKQISESTFSINNYCLLEFMGCGDLKIETYDYAVGFNKKSVGKKISICFKNKLETKIII